MEMYSEPAGRAALYQFLDRALAGLRWATLGALLLLALAKPLDTQLGISNWALLGLFAAYSAVITLAGVRLVPPRRLAWRAILDLPASALVYLLSAEPGGPLFVLLFLAVVCAALSLTLRGSLLYTAAAATFTAASEPLLPGWAPTATNMRDLGTRLVMLGLAGAGMALLRRRLVLEQLAAEAVRGQASQLAELDRTRMAFLSTVSHELRTPFTAMRAGLGMVETSMADRLHSDERQLLGNVRRNIDRLGIYINDLLAFNQIEAGRLILEREPLDLRTSIANALAGVELLLAEKGQTVALDLPAPLLVEGDPRRLEQVIINLLDNANRHTPPGTHITITGRATAGEVRLTVQDTGPGIPPAEQTAIFERFYRGASVEAGSGLGLAIAQAIINLHQGRIWVESGPQQTGTVFHIILPGSTEGGRE